MLEHGDSHARALLAFRDALRADPRLADRYAVLKERLAARFRTQRNAYTNAKADFVDQVLRDVGTQPPSRERLPEQ